MLVTSTFTFSSPTTSITLYGAHVPFYTIQVGESISRRWFRCSSRNVKIFWELFYFSLAIYLKPESFQCPQRESFRSTLHDKSFRKLLFGSEPAWNEQNQHKQTDAHLRTRFHNYITCIISKKCNNCWYYSYPYVLHERGYASEHSDQIKKTVTSTT